MLKYKQAENPACFCFIEEDAYEQDSYLYFRTISPWMFYSGICPLMSILAALAKRDAGFFTPNIREAM